jgi:hypothetical protein
MLRSPELASAVRARLQAELRNHAIPILGGAIDRREIPADIDLDLATDALSALVYWRVIVSEGAADDKYLDHLVDFIVAGLSSKR